MTLAGNPYSYAGNDPLHALDPTGLKPVSEADLKEAAKGSWWHRNNGWVIGGLATLAGGALMLTGFGGPAGAMLLSFGTDALIQQTTTGSVNYKQSLVAGAFGGAGFVASKGLYFGRAGMMMKNAKTVDKIISAERFGTKTKLALGAGEGYTYQVAGGADPGSMRAIGGGVAGLGTAGIGIRGDALGDAAKKRIVDRATFSAALAPGSAAAITRFGSLHGGAVALAHKVPHAMVGGGSGEFVRQVTDDEPGIDFGKIGGKTLGGGLAKPLPTGISSPAGKGLSTGFDSAVS